MPVGSEEVPGQFVATGVSADGDDHVREVLGLHHLTLETLLHHPADRKRELIREDSGNCNSLFFNLVLLMCPIIHKVHTT